MQRVLVAAVIVLAFRFAMPPVSWSEVIKATPDFIEATGKGLEIVRVETGNVILNDDHIAAYVLESHKIILTDAGVKRWRSFVPYDDAFDPPIPKLGPLTKQRFVLNLNGEEIYPGRFWSLLLSSIGEGVMIYDVLIGPARSSELWVRMQHLPVNLRQPRSSQKQVSPTSNMMIANSTAARPAEKEDPRGDERLLDYLRSQDKLRSP